MANHDYDDLLESFMNNSSKAYEDDKNLIKAKKELEEESRNSRKTKSLKGKKSREIEKEIAKEKEQKGSAKGKRRKPAKDVNPVIKILVGILIVIGVVGIVCFSVITIYGYSVVYGDPVFNLNEEKYNQNQTSFIYSTNSKGENVEVARLYGEENRIWVDESKMSKYMSEAFIALEDKRFEKHGGVDWKRTISVFVKQNGQGGSTITQQLIKNLTDENQATYIRKFNEILSALNIEKNYSKKEIIEAYMNTVYLSNGCYGVKTAAEKYFGKDVGKLNIAECASIAAITQWPNHYDPLFEPENNRKRQLVCLKNMYDQGLISKTEYDDAVNYKMVFTNSKGYKGSTVSSSNKANKSSINSYYTDFVIDSVLSDLQKQGYSAKTAKKMLYGGGLKIYSAVNNSIQKKLENIYKNHIKMLDDKVQGACVVMDYKGRVLAIVGGTGKKTANRVLNRATQSQRQPGSTIKPLSVYGPAIEKSLQDDDTDIYWSSILSDSPFMRVDGELWPHNAGGGYSGNNVTIQYGLSRSLNTISVRTLNEIGTDYSYKFITDNFHISTLDPADDDYAPLATGSLTNGVTALEMTAAYATFGNGGYYYEPYCYYKIEDSQGKEIIKKDPDSTKKQSLSTNSAWVMNKLLQTVLTEGTGTAFRLSGVEAYAKTGTTDDAKDLWFMAGTPSFVTGIWYGYDSPEAINYSYASPCGLIWNYLMSDIYDNNSKLATKFKVPDGVVQRKYCTSTGKLATSSCYSTAYGWFDEDNLPGYCGGGHGGGSSKSYSSSSSSNNSNSNSNDSDNNSSETTAAATTQAVADDLED